MTPRNDPDPGEPRAAKAGRGETASEFRTFTIAVPHAIASLFLLFSGPGHPWLWEKHGHSAESTVSTSGTGIAGHGLAHPARDLAFILTPQLPDASARHSWLLNPHLSHLPQRMSPLTPQTPSQPTTRNIGHTWQSTINTKPFLIPFLTKNPNLPKYSGLAVRFPPKHPSRTLRKIRRDFFICSKGYNNGFLNFSTRTRDTRVKARRQATALTVEACDPRILLSTIPAIVPATGTPVAYHNTTQTVSPACKTATPTTKPR